MAGFGVPIHLRTGLAMWIMQGIEPGGFMQCVLRNDLQGAAVRADKSSLHSLDVLVRWLISEAPPACWGSDGTYADWANSGGWKGLDDAGKRAARLVR